MSSSTPPITVVPLVPWWNHVQPFCLPCGSSTNSCLCLEIYSCLSRYFSTYDYSHLYIKRIESIISTAFSLDSTFLILSFKADLEACQLEEILLVRDPDKVYGEHFFFTCTAEALETQMAVIAAGEEKEKARLAAEEEVKFLQSPHVARGRCIVADITTSMPL